MMPTATSSSCSSSSSSTWTATTLAAILVTVFATLLIPASAAAVDVASPSTTHHQSPEIEMIDVMCDAEDVAMQVTIAFAQPFDGLIYSQGYFNQEKCRYVATGGSDSVYTFRVPIKGCGSERSCQLCDSVSNVLVIQSDEDVQEVWDTARRVTCDRPLMPGNFSKSTAVDQHHSTNSNSAVINERTIIFKPFVVDQLEVINVPTARGGVDCWLDVQRGRFPAVQPLVQSIQIGETLSVIVFLRDPTGAYDLTVRDCYAFDNADYEAKTTSRLQLSDERGCSRKPKLFGRWQRTEGAAARKADATLVLHNALSAFKFPDQTQVFLKCEVEICSGKCAPADCETAKGNTTTAIMQAKRPTVPTTEGVVGRGSGRRPTTTVDRIPSGKPERTPIERTTGRTPTDRNTGRTPAQANPDREEPTTSESRTPTRTSRRTTTERTPIDRNSGRPTTAGNSWRTPVNRTSGRNPAQRKPDAYTEGPTTIERTPGRTTPTDGISRGTQRIPDGTSAESRTPTQTTSGRQQMTPSGRNSGPTTGTTPESRTQTQQPERSTGRTPTQRNPDATTPNRRPTPTSNGSTTRETTDRTRSSTHVTAQPRPQTYPSLSTKLDPYPRSPSQRTTPTPARRTNRPTTSNSAGSTPPSCSPATDPRCSFYEPEDYLPPLDGTTTTTTKRPRPTFAACPPGSRSPNCPPPDTDFEGPDYLPPFAVHQPIPQMDIDLMPPMASTGAHRHVRQSALPQTLPATNEQQHAEAIELAERINAAFASAQQQMQRRRRRRRSIAGKVTVGAEAEVQGSESITFAMSVKGYNA